MDKFRSMRSLVSMVFSIFLLISLFSVGHASRVDMYHQKDIMVQMWKDLSDENPDFMGYEVIGHSVSGKEIYLFKIGNPSGGRVMFDGSVHGPEDTGTELEYLFAKWVLESEDESAKHILSRNYMLFIPIINVDSVNRQNLRRNYTLDNGTIISAPYGVDLNRNFVYGWGQSGSSDPQNKYEYRGLYPGSEPETQAVRYAMQTYRPKVYLNTHVGDRDYLVYWEKKELETTIINNMKEITSETGAAMYSTFRAGRGGYVIADAYSFNASAWMIETSSWDDLPADYDEFVARDYPRFSAVLLAMCKAVEEPNIDPVCTPSIVNTSWSWWYNITSICLENNTYQQRRQLKEYDSNFCGETANKTYYEYRSRYCGFCTLSLVNTSWSTWSDYTSCQLNNTLSQRRSLKQYDVNYCNEVANKSFYQYQSKTCDYCAPSLTNTSWSSWTDYTSCQSNNTYVQRSSLKQYDKNSCNEVANKTFYKYQQKTCDFCTPSMTNTSWTGWYNTTGICLLNDIYNQKRYLKEYDKNYCNEIANKTYYGYRTQTCDFCTPKLTNVSKVWVNVTACSGNDTYTQKREIIQYDTNSCGEISNKTFIEYRTETCDYLQDGIIGNLSVLNTNINGLLFEIDDSWLMDSKKLCRFKENNMTILEFEFDFSLGKLNFFEMVIHKQDLTESKGSMRVKGINLTTQNLTKTVYIDNIEGSMICIVDNEDTDISSISDQCNAEGEISLLCDGTENNGYKCTIEDGRYKVEGLKHSAVKEYTYTAPAVPAPVNRGSSGSGGGGSSGWIKPKPVNITPEVEEIVVAPKEEQPEPVIEEQAEPILSEEINKEPVYYQPEPDIKPVIEEKSSFFGNLLTGKSVKDIPGGNIFAALAGMFIIVSVIELVSGAYLFFKKPKG